MFKLGLSTKEFDDSLKKEAEAAKKMAKDVADMFANIKLPAINQAAQQAKLLAQAKEAEAKARLANAKAAQIESRATSGSGSGNATQNAERQKQAINQLTAQLYKLAEAQNKVNFAQTNRGAMGALTANAQKQISAAAQQLQALRASMQSGAVVPRSTLQVAMEQATRSIREANTAISQQRALNAAADRQKLASQNAILERQRAINRAQAENTRLIMRSNGQFSIMRNIVGQVGSAIGTAFSIYALQNFIKDLVRIRGEFDMQYTALKAILQSGQQANELFSQLKTLAPISPYSFKDLTSYAKQLSAYSIPYNELFDTTKRLADLSSGLGVDFYRIVLAYGQVRSAAVLRGQELRQFTEAGIPMVDELAKKFTKLKGEVVSAGDVFELISERQVPFEMVKEVIDDLTNEGGKFYMMQEKQAETLKGKMSNLQDRYDIMMNSLGEANDGVLKGTADALAAIMEHANTLVNVIEKLAIVWGIWKLATVAQTAVMGKNLSAMTAEEAKSRVKQANLLREAQLYRELTIAERNALAKRGTTAFGTSVRTKLSSNELGQLAMSQRITANEALRLAYLGKIDRYTLGHLQKNKLITQQQVQQVMLARQQAVSFLPKMLRTETMINGVVSTRLALMKLGQGIMAGLGAIFNPTTLVIGGITAALSAWSEYKEHQKQMEENAQRIADNARESYDELRRYIAENPLEIKAGTEIDESMIAETLRRDIEEIQKTIPQPLANGLVTNVRVDENGKERSLTEQAQKAREILESASTAQVVLQDVKKQLEEAADDTDAFWFFGDSLKTNIADFADDWEEYQSALNGVSRPEALLALQKSGLEKVSEDARTLASQLKDSTVSMQAIYDTAHRLYNSHSTFQSAIDFMKNSGFMNVEEAKYGGLFEQGYVGQFETMSSQIDETVANLKTRIENKLKPMGIELGSDTGKIVVETLKKSWMEDNGITDGDARQMFGFLFDRQMLGGTDAAFNMLGTELGTKLSDNAMQAVKKFKENDIWTDEMTAACNEAKDKLIEKFPELKDELTAAWNVNPATFRVYISTTLAAQKVEAWKQYMMDVLGDKYDIAIRTTTNVKQAQEEIQKVYDSAKKYLEQQKPLGMKLGVAWNTQGLQSWVNSHRLDKDQTTFAIMQNVLRAFQTIDEGQPGVEKGWINDNKSTPKKNKPKGGSSKDKVTEDLQKQYDSQKKALAKYRELAKTVSSETAKGIIKEDYGVELQDSWLTQFGQIDLITATLNKLGKRATDAAKNFRKSLNDEKSALLADKDVFGYSVIAENLSKDVDLLEKRFKIYDDFFKKSGNANLSALIAFGDQTKPYKDIVAATKAEFQKALDSDKGNKLKVDDLLGLSDEEIKKQLPEKYQSAFDGLKKKIASGNENARSLLETVFSKTDDEDVKIAVNNANKEELLNNLSNLLFGDTKELSEEQQQKLDELRPMIEDYYNNLNKELTLEKTKKSMNWEELFGDIGSLSITQLDMLISQLEKIVQANNDLDPQKMKEWVSQLDKLKEARAKLEPYKGLFAGMKAVHNTRVKRDDIAEQIKAMPITAQYQDAQNKGDLKAMEQLGQTMVTLNGETMTYTKALEALTAATEAYKAAQKSNTKSQDWLMGVGNDIFGQGFSEDFGNFAGIFGVINQNAQSMDELRKKLGIDDDTVVGKLTGSIAGLSGGVSSAVQSAMSGDVFGALNGLYDGFFNFGSAIFGGADYSSYNKMKEEYESLISVWDVLIDRKNEYIDTAYTEEINQTKEEIEALTANEIKAYQTLGKERLNSGASTGSHSIGVRIREGMSGEGWEELREWASGQDDTTLYSKVANGRMTGLFDLSVEQLKSLQETAPTFWAKLDNDVREYLEKIIAAGDALEDSLDKVKEKLTGTTADEIADSFASALDSMDDQTKTFADNFTKTLRNAIIQAYVNSTAVKNKIQKWYDMAAEYMSNEDKQGDSEITDWEKNDLLNNPEYGWNTIADGMSNFQDTLKSIGAYADQTSGSLSGGIKSITEETADLLASYVNAIRADVAFIRGWYVEHFADNSQMQDVVTTISVAVAQIQVNTRRNADIAEDINALLNSVTKTTANGKAIRVS